MGRYKTGITKTMQSITLDHDLWAVLKNSVRLYNLKYKKQTNLSAFIQTILIIGLTNYDVNEVGGETIEEYDEKMKSFNLGEK